MGNDLVFSNWSRFDKAAVMSFPKNGSQANIAEKYPNAVYVHCHSHALNLATSSSYTSVSSTCNHFDNVKKLTCFLSCIAKCI